MRPGAATARRTMDVRHRFRELVVHVGRVLQRHALVAGQGVAGRDLKRPALADSAGPAAVPASCTGRSRSGTALLVALPASARFSIRDGITTGGDALSCLDGAGHFPLSSARVCATRAFA